ncbi:uncharacterized protein LAESUDRAFT_716513 [Laetiporus sulphureus 93-53]|uniref:BTB domain-containing protein n=1 Tax=Laetiporus sulphureus 93-53 TaxID=1314785 RepID=A0A165CJI1_9APHY|nr:uncharacterized protein LAESUDRAFT_716513 [Laetiporus sulphureus 93-53]KZT02924.1 hypothetical protein LAESUDRAFT_716513 [Laetiporus sulphureus 93-53]
MQNNMSTVHSSNWHPLFTTEDAGTITLSSQDANLFRIHLYTLKRASGWFAAMSSLPQGPGTISDDVLHLDEDSTVLMPLLQVISGMELPDLSSLDLVESILLAAEKYDMPGPVSIIRNMITSYLSESTALRVYRLAGAHSWKAQAQLASSYTLSLDLSTPTAIAELSRMEGYLPAQLFLLHRQGKDALKKALNDVTRFAANTKENCEGCRRSPDHAQWRNLKELWLSRADEAPFGRTISAAQLIAPEVLSVIEATCPSCRRRLYNADMTFNNLRDAVNNLPQTVMRLKRPFTQSAQMGNLEKAHAGYLCAIACGDHTP